METILSLRKKYYNRTDQLDFDLILEACLKMSRSFILAHPEYKITNNELRIMSKFLKRRVNGEPLAYILGHKEFYGLDFLVNKNVLIPRPETEMIIEEAVRFILKRKAKINIIDIGTGSGCIAVTLAKILNKKITAIDISTKALNIAKKNAKIHKVDKIVKFIKSDLLKSIFKDKKLIIDNCELIIVCNLPYVDENRKNLLDSAETRGLKFEPSIALYSGDDGLDLYRKLAGQTKSLRKLTKKPINIFCEIGHKQAGEMKKIFAFAKSVEIKKDGNCLDRSAIIKA